MMRKTLGLAAAAVLTAGTLGVQPTTATASPAASRVGAADPSAAADAALRALAERPGLARVAKGVEQEVERRVEQELSVTDTMLDRDGSSHVRMERTYRGLPVLGGDLVVHQSAASQLQGVSQTLEAPITVSATPKLAATRAATRAVSTGKAATTIKRLRPADAEPQLVVDALGAKPRLAWAIQTKGRQADGTPSRLTTYVDARNGAVLRRVEGIHTADGEGNSLYSGTVPISVTASGGSFTLTDAAHGNARTTDMQNGTDGFLCTLLGFGCTNGVTYTSPDNVFGNGTNANRESAAVDAHYGGAMTYDYYDQVLGRDGIFGDGTGAPSRVHYGSNYVNAFWDGEKMTYGDGDGSSFGPLVSLDVAGHEMSHGVTENTAGLVYSGESGGLNEATSDIFGTMVEFYADNAEDPADYFIGEEFDLANGEGFRRMDNPSLDGSSQSCYASDTDSVDVHYSSGVGNHFYYLLAEGSGAKTIGGKQHSSPTCNGSSVSGIGRDAAQQIWFRALTTYFTSGTTYAQARTGTLSAAADLYGQGSAERAAVAAAWSAVNVG
ncbi:M4 family metallopeptidase [Nocardioides sp.]|jgi:Zn-dependent metalloprotease|uniref:M4 family metallopeptidase n=1 Tax=Nocardioides sp. TaxID=35761 RepID=UPI00261A2185|nr:M4 family metallopeptidase [Nocardioides sp.]